jgi:hypothetical protein
MMGEFGLTDPSQRALVRLLYGISTSAAMLGAISRGQKVQSRRTGSAILGVLDEAGELVSFDITAEFKGQSLVSFVGVVTSLACKSLAHLYGRDLILDINGGPAIGVTIVQIDEHEAIIQLRLA